MTSRRRVLYVQYTNPAAYPPLEHSAQILADAGFEVLLLGIQFRNAAMSFEPNPRISTRLLPYQSRGWRQKAHYVWFALWTFFWAIRWRPTWVYASDPLSCPAAWLIAVVGRRRVIYHEHDTPELHLPGRPTSRFMRTVLRARAALARRAEFCVLPNKGRAEALQPADVSRVVTVWNCPSRTEVVAGRDRATSGHLRVLYHGSIGPVRVPVSVIQAMVRLSPSVSLTIAGYETPGNGGYVQRLLDVAASLGIADRVSFAGTLSPRHELLAHCAGHDVGLAFVSPDSTALSERTLVGASNKPFEYLACGVPVLVTDLPDWRATYVDAGYGRACDPLSAESVEAAFKWLLDHPAERRTMGERGRLRVMTDWNYEARFAPVLARMQAVAG